MIDEGDENGTTPLIIAAGGKSCRVARVLLEKGADISKVSRYGLTALQMSAQAGNLSVCKLLMDAGADLEAKTPEGLTPLHLSVEKGNNGVMRALIDAGADVNGRSANGATPLHRSARLGHAGATKELLRAKADLEAKTPEGNTPLHLSASEGYTVVMRALLDAGANVNSRSAQGSTPLYYSARKGLLEATRVLLRAKADALLVCTRNSVSTTPLDAAASEGHSAVVLELVDQVGIERCGGASGGEAALSSAASEQHSGVMAVLAAAGVVDSGKALLCAARMGYEAIVMFLLKQHNGGVAGGSAYANYSNDVLGATPLVAAISSCSPRIVRALVDAGADTASAVGTVNFTPLDVTLTYIRGKVINSKEATERQLNRLEAIRRLLLRVEAVHAVSWSWASTSAPAVVHAAEGSGRKRAASGSVRMMMPVLRQRARRGVLLAPLFRWVVLPRLSCGDVLSAQVGKSPLAFLHCT